MHVKSIKLLILTTALSAVSFGTSLSTSIGFPSAPQSPGCTKSRIDNLSTVCMATNNASYGTSVISIYGDVRTHLVILGTIQATQPSGSSVTMKSSYTATITDFAGLSSGGVTVSNDKSSFGADSEDIQVSDNTGNVIATLSNNSSVNIPYGKASSIVVYGIHTTTGTEDYQSLTHVTLTKY